MSPGVLAVAAAIAIAAAGSAASVAQDYPTKPVRIVTTEVGSGNDLVARMIAPGLGASLGQQVIVENRGIVAGEVVFRALPDGYTLLSYGSPLWLGPLMRSVPYDPIKDFAPITLAVSSPNILVVHPALPVKAVKDLIALARAKPGQLNYGSSSTGATPHLAAELFKAMAGVEIVRIPYKGSGPALNALIGGQVQLMFPNAGAVTQHIKSGRVTALGVASLRPSALAPDLATIASSGLPGYESSSPFALFAPAKTPDAITQRLNLEIVRILQRPDIKEKLFNSGIEVVASTRQELSTAIRSEVARLGKIIKDVGIRDE